MEKQFTIEANPAAFEILSSKLYSNPHLAVVRELITNANDAHVESNVTKEIELHVPAKNENYFYIRDFGKGLSEIEVEQIYTTFFISTKTDDLEQTGSFGLGSKTPFTLVEEYFVTSYNNNSKKTYLMSKKSGFPVVKKISEEPTNETGLEIRFDYEDNTGIFLENAKEFLSKTNFPIKSNVFNDVSDAEMLKILKKRQFYSKDNVKYLLEKYDYWSDVTVNVAGIIYEIDKNILPKNFYEKIDRKIKINICATKEDIAIAPSREMLHYDEKTKNFISNKVNEVIQNYEDNLLLKIEQIQLPQLILIKERAIF